MKGVEPIYLRSTVSYSKWNIAEEAEFIYPSGLRWTCTRCGACCRDPEERERRILLLGSDLDRLRRGGVDLAEATKESSGTPPFVAEMAKRDGACVLLARGGCTAYESRGLLCRTYPFWVEKQDGLLIVRFDDGCPGFGSGEPVTEGKLNELLRSALEEVES